jgi:voltage-gated potassium channel
MLRIILTGIVMVGITVLIHAMGTIWVGRFLLKKLLRHQGHIHTWGTLPTLATTAVFLLLILFVEAIAWSYPYFMMPEDIGLKSFEDALYFSLATFTTVGYGDITLQGSWRLLAGIEAMNGVLLLGWSSASLYTVVSHLWKNSIHDMLESAKKEG